MNSQAQQQQLLQSQQEEAMPAALILDDSSVEEMMVPSSPHSSQTEGKPPAAIDYYDGIICAGSSSHVVVPSDDYYEGDMIPCTDGDDDSEMSDVDESTFVASVPHDSNINVNIPPPCTSSAKAPQHNAIPSSSSSLLSSALEILNSPSAETPDLLAVMRALPCEPHIQGIACEKLWVQTFDEDEAMRLAQEGGISLVLEAMARFPHHIHLQHCAGEVLQNVASMDDAWFAHEICQRGGVTILVHAMRNHPEHQGLQLCGCITLASLAEADPNNRDHIQETGGIDAVLYAKWNHEDQESVVLGAQQALEALGHEENDSDL